MRQAVKKFRLSPDQRLAMGARVACRREQRGWSQRELARRAAVDASRLWKIEHGWVAPTLSELAGLSVALDACLDELVWGEAPELARLLHSFAALTAGCDRELVAQVLRALSAALSGGTTLRPGSEAPR
jgi:ribosome-binding protein aMBF1 (putative translation factor)